MCAEWTGVWRNITRAAWGPHDTSARSPFKHPRAGHAGLMPGTSGHSTLPAIQPWGLWAGIKHEESSGTVYVHTAHVPSHSPAKRPSIANIAHSSLREDGSARGRERECVCSGRRQRECVCGEG